MPKKFSLKSEKTARNTILELIFLGLLKALVGIFTGMSIIIADAISTFANLLSIFIAYIGIKISRKNADENFEYGYYKIETFAAFIISIWIIVMGYFILKESINTFFEFEEGKYRAFALTTTLISIQHSYNIEKKLRLAGEANNSLSLLASARNKKIEIFAGVGIFISILANYKSVPYIEAIVIVLLAILVLKEGIYSTKESLFFLLDYWNNPKLTQQIRSTLLLEHEVITKIKKLRMRRAGAFIFGEAFVDVNPFVGIEDLRAELDMLQLKIKDLNPYIKDFSIYTHITKESKTKIAIPLSSGEDLTGTIATSLSKTKKYLFLDLNKGEIVKQYSLSLSKKDKKTINLINFLKKEQINILIDNNLNSLTYYNLRRTHHILIYPHFSDIKEAGEILKLLSIDL